MQLKMMMLFTMIMCVLSLPSFAGSPVPHFVKGEYKLVGGELSECGQGQFFLRDSNSNLALGVHHGFNTKNKEEVFPSDIPEEKGCRYDVKDEVDVFDDKSQLTFTEHLRCGKLVKHILTKKATIAKNKISLKVEQTGDEAFSYSCDWALK